SSLRLSALEAFAGLAVDIVVVGDGQSEVRLLVFPANDLLLGGRLDAKARLKMQLALRSLAERGTGSASRPVAALIVDDPPSTQFGDLREKGTINSRALLRNRPSLVPTAYGDEKNPYLVTLSSPAIC